jgi:hypothetical protein
MARSSEWSLSFRFYNQNIECIFHQVYIYVPNKKYFGTYCDEQIYTWCCVMHISAV